MRAWSMALQKEPVVRRALDEIIDERPVLQMSAAALTWRHGTARPRRRAPSVLRRCPRFAGLAWRRYCSSTSARCCRMNSERETPPARADRREADRPPDSRGMVAFFLENAQK